MTRLYVGVNVRSIGISQMRLSKGKAIEEADVPIIVDALDLEEVLRTLEEDREIQIELEDFASQNYGELEFDAWKPIKIFQFTLTEDGDIDEDNEPNVVWEV